MHGEDVKIGAEAARVAGIYLRPVSINAIALIDTGI